MKAVILSAGEGRRMRPLTLTKPKTMLPIAGKPIIQYNIEALRDNGITDILLIVKYKEELVKDYFKDGKDFGVNIGYKTQDEPAGTADAIGYSKEFIEDDNLIVLNGDIILDKELISEIITDYESSRFDTLMVLTEVEDPSHYGVVEMQGILVKNIIEKPEKEDAPSNLINAGIYIFNKDIFDKISRTEISSRGEFEITDSLLLQIKDDKNIKGFVTDKKWIDIGMPWDLLEINELIINQIKENINGKIEDGVTIHGTIFLGEGSIIRSGVYIEGSVYIGKNCDIGPNSFIRGNSYFGDNVNVGNAVEIKNSIIMEHTKINHLSYVGDSVIGSRCNIGAGTNVANLRFDDKPVLMTVKGQKTNTGRRKLGSVIGDNVKTGINTSFSPGVTVGFNSFIGPGILLQNDVESNKVVLLKQQHTVDNLKK
ncbi:MAG: NTP transferase domain-containing protein [Methanobrevibacter sp.]|jgi:bifunctional UDP-N-acetylglucosamine pyrophosphorylase/glucosamine-1-phosphate N-acetyltransferase|nr:NTP transferase domain-containing protein [Candidatus Methanovirga aequatorialis]